ncbi:MAG: methyltransferase family protein [Acidobacteriota bacterium]
MNKKFQKLVFRTRGVYMFIGLATGAGVKIAIGGTTPLSLFAVGVAIAAIAQIYRVWVAAYLGGKQAVTEIQADFLCTAGPYAYVRNPLYIGNFPIGIGLAMAINEWYAYALFAMSYALVYLVVIPYEEQFLTQKFGTAYAEYKEYTGRLIPKLPGYKKAQKVIPDYWAGFWGEIHVPIILAVLFTIAYWRFVR